MDIKDTKSHDLCIDIGYGESIAVAIETLQQALKEAEELGAVYTSFYIDRGSDGYVDVVARIPKTEEELAVDRARELEEKNISEARERMYYEKLKAKYEK